MPDPVTANFGWPKPDPANPAQSDAQRIAEAFDGVDETLGALILGTIFVATSTSEVEIGPGEKAFTIAAGRGFRPSDFVLATSDADPANYLYGQVAAYAGETLTIEALLGGGAGTHADWVIRIAGARGVPGGPGAPGEPGDDGAPGEPGADATLEAVAEDVLPDTDSTRDLGSAAKAWAEMWADRIGDPASGALVLAQYVVQGSARVWGSVYQPGTQVLRGSFNVASITDTGVGRTRFNFSAAMADANYAAVFNMRMGTAGSSNYGAGVFAEAAGNVEGFSQASEGTDIDTDRLNVIVMGALA